MNRILALCLFPRNERCLSETVLRVLSSLCCGWVGIALLWGAVSAAAEETADFEKSSLAWRTALHFDPAAEAPLESLVKLYSEAGRLADLVGLYVGHLASYPDDASARLVLARLYQRTGDVRTEGFLERVLAQSPKDAELMQVWADFLEETHRPGAMEARVRAILLTPDVVRRDAWMTALIADGPLGGAEAQVVEMLTDLARREDVTDEERVRWAGLALQSGFVKGASVLLSAVDGAKFSGERWIEVTLLETRVALGEGRLPEAVAKVDAVLERLAADHWRRGEALRLRWECAATEEERAALLQGSLKRWEASPASEAEALSHGEMLIIAGRAREAVVHLRRALERVPESRAVERRMLDLMDAQRMDEEALSFLEVRLAAVPERLDLAEMRARRLLGLGRVAEGVGALLTVTGALSDGDALEQFLATSRWLRQRNLFSEAAAVLEEGLKRNPGMWSLRRELGELLATLRRSEELAGLFAVPISDAVPLEVRMETAMFLVGQSLWPEARACLSGWVESHPAEFEARVLLARICVLTGDVTEGERLLMEARERADTEARYAAWLAAARSFAEESGREAAFYTEERKRLEPEGGGWDARGLERLVQLGSFAAEESKVEEAEALVKEALAVPGLGVGARRELQMQQVRLLTVQTDRVKEMEALLRALLADTDEEGGAEDLRTRLILLYARAERADLMREELGRLNLARCEDAGILGQLAPMLQSRGWRRMHADCAERLVQLQPDHPENWSRLISALVELGNESGLRARLMDLRAVLVSKGLSEGMEAQIRDHWVSSCWRGIARVLARHDAKPPMAVMAPMLADLEVMPLTRDQRLWKEWLLAWLGGEPPESWKADGEAWVRFPDGLVFSGNAAEAMLQGDRSGEQGGEGRDETSAMGMTGPLEMAWGLRAREGRGFLQWALLADRDTVVVMDSALDIQAVELVTGRLKWTRPMGPWTRGLVVPASESREIVLEPMEWAVADGALVVLAPMGVICLDAETGEPRWELPVPAGVNAMAPGAVAAGNGRVFWWRVETGMLDAFDMASGRLVWSVSYPELAREPVTPSNQPVSVSTGVDYDSGRVLVWGNGNAVCSEEGQILWKAAARDAEAIFPFQVNGPEKGGERQAEEIAKVNRVRAAMSWSTFPAPAQGGSGAVLPQGLTLSNPLGMAAPAFSGVYGQMGSSPWLTWGSEGVRKLDGARFWMVDRSGVSVCRAMGIPLGSAEGRTGAGRGFFLGVANGSLITVGSTSVERLEPDGTATTLWSETWTGGKPATHPMAAAGLDGRILGVATRSALRFQDAVTGTLLWEGDWPEEVTTWAPEWKRAFEDFQSMRWSSKGVWLADGNGTSRALDWRSLISKGHWVVPIGPGELVCLKSVDER